MMEFIEKFRASANRAKLVQSRVKMFEKMDLEAPEQVVVDSLWRSRKRCSSIFISSAIRSGRMTVLMREILFKFRLFLNHLRPLALCVLTHRDRLNAFGR